MSDASKRPTKGIDRPTAQRAPKRPPLKTVAQEQEWVPCWCGKPAAWTEFTEAGPPILLCMDHKPQYEVKMVRGAVYGLRKVIDIAICRNCSLPIRLVHDKDSKFEVPPAICWVHTQTGRWLCHSTEAEPAVPA